MIFYLLAILLAVAALTLLVVFSSINGDANMIVGFSVYGAALLGFYIVRAVYVATHSEKTVKKTLVKLDHVMIYLFTAATYTPVALMLPDRGWGWSIFGVVWGISLVGSLLRLTEKVDKKWTTLGVYGSLIVLNIVTFTVVHEFLTKQAVFWLSLGSFAYVLETFLVVARPKWVPLKRIDSFETLALPFVVFGSFAHFWAMLKHMIL